MGTNRKKSHLIKWQMVMKEKKDGGLEVRNLKMHNKRYFVNGSEDIVRKVMRES